jgi:hypothetical protein
VLKRYCHDYHIHCSGPPIHGAVIAFSGEMGRVESLTNPQAPIVLNDMVKRNQVLLVSKLSGIARDQGYEDLGRDI